MNTIRENLERMFVATAMAEEWEDTMDIRSLKEVGEKLLTTFVDIAMAEEGVSPATAAVIGKNRTAARGSRRPRGRNIADGRLCQGAKAR